MFRRSGKLKIVLLAVVMLVAAGAPSGVQANVDETVAARRTERVEAKRVSLWNRLLMKITRYAMAAN